VGLNYGPNFALIAQGWSIGSASRLQVLACFALDNKPTLDLANHLVHPAVLDCSFQLIIQLLREHTDFSEGIAFVPTQLGTLHFDTQAGQPHSARATLIRHLPHSLVVDFSLFDAAGRLVCEVSNARFKRIRLKQDSKRPIERLLETLTPAPKYPELTPSRIDFTSLAKAATQFELRLRQDPAQRVFAQELDPLLDTLCARLAVEFLHDPTRASERQACSAEYLDMLTGLAEENIEHAGASANDIWNTLVRDYSDFSQTIRYVGQLGQAPATVKALPQAHFASEWLGNTGLSQFVRLVSQQVTTAQAQLRAQDRLSLLVFGAEDARLASHLSINVDTTALDIAIGSAVFSSASLNTESTSDIFADLVIFWADYSTQGEQDEALQQALRSMKPGATLLLLGQHPSQWMRFAFGQFDLQPRSRSRWMATLASLGLEEITPSAHSDDLLAGPFVLVGRKPALANTERNRPPRMTAQADTPQSWLILAHEEPAQTKLADQWTRLLQEQGDIGSVLVLPPSTESGFDPATVTSIENALTHSQTQFGTLDKIVYLGGVCLAADVSTITERCLTLVAALKACEAQAIETPVWCLTTSANDRTKAVSGATALQGFARSVLNEAAAGRLRLLDAVLSEPANLFLQETLVQALVQECTDPSMDEEVVLTETGGRYVSRTQVETDTRKQNTLNHPELYCALEFAQPGQLRNLRWVAAERPALESDAIEVAVDATGLNFRDVMYTLGLLSDEAIEQGFAGPTLGLEFAGRVARVGEAVTHLSVGDRVVGFGPSCFANYVVTAAAAATRIPRALSNKSAATIPSTFLTSYYALHHLAKLSKGERVLIHGAAGGVGLAAIQIARWCGAEVFATAGSEEKRNYLRMLGVPHVLDSRTLDYADDIMRLTDGAGVDVVLNSLSGEAITRNLSVLKPFGRFLELGKRDFYENTRIGLRPFRQNISYFGIDADQLLKHRPALTQQLFSEVMDLFEDGTLSALPYTRFEAHEIVDAFRFMQQSKQIGKVVVTYVMGIECQNTPPKPKSLTLSADGTYVVTGGRRGFGLRTARWLVEKGARQVLLLGRSGVAPDDVEALDTIQAMRDAGARVDLVQCDVTNRTELETALGDRDLRGVIHAAAVIEDSLAFNLTAETLHKVLAPKILGAQHLHDLSSKWKLDFFVLYSSATTFFGNPGQAAYVAANRWLEALAETRAQAGQPVTCMRWGAIEDAGFLARNTQIKQALSQRMGGAALPAELAMQYLEQAIVAGTPNLGVLELEWGALRKFLPNATSPRFAALAERAGEAAHQGDQATDIAALVRDLDDEALTTKFAAMIQAELGQILRLDPEKIPATKSVYELGLDSLMGVELITALEARFGVRLPVMAISEDATIERLAVRLIGLLRKDQQTDATVQAIEDIAAQHVADASPEEIEAFAQSLDSTNGRSSEQAQTQADTAADKQDGQRSLLS
jgi:NADPH:quinone reductase-like Zn-dependent oxidoreductase/NAD(P)-dependent dehydrogenase (short-subunit alcohol dehydrogenase family)/acyl carrier protein